MKHLTNSTKKMHYVGHQDIQIKSSDYPNQYQQYREYQQFSMPNNYLNTQRSQKSIKSTTCIPQKLYQVSSHTKTQPSAYQPSRISSFQNLTQIYGEVSKMKNSISQIQQSLKSFKVIIDQVEEQRSYSGLRNDNIFQKIKNQINNLTFILNHQLHNAECNTVNQTLLGNLSLSNPKLLNSSYQVEESFRRCSIQLEQNKFNILLNHPQSNKLMKNMTTQSLNTFIQIQIKYQKICQYLESLSISIRPDQAISYNQNQEMYNSQSLNAKNINIRITNAQKNNPHHNNSKGHSQNLHIIQEEDRNRIQIGIKQFLKRIQTQTQGQIQTENTYEIKRIKNSFKQKFIKKVKQLFEEYSVCLKKLISQNNASQNKQSYHSFYEQSSLGYSLNVKNNINHNDHNTRELYNLNQNEGHIQQSSIQILESFLISVQILRNLSQITEQVYYSVRYFQCLLHQYEDKLRQSLEIQEQDIKNLSLCVKKETFEPTLKRCQQKIFKCQLMISQIYQIQDYFGTADKFKIGQFFKNIFYRHGNGVFSQKEKHKIQNYFKNKKIYMTYVIDYLNIQKIINFKCKKLKFRIQQERLTENSTQNIGFSQQLMIIRQNILQKLLYPYQLIEKVQNNENKYRQYILNGIIYNSTLHSQLDKIHNNQEYELFQNKEGPFLIQKIKQMISTQNQRFKAQITSLYHKKCNKNGNNEEEDKPQNKLQNKCFQKGNEITKIKTTTKINESANFYQQKNNSLLSLSSPTEQQFSLQLQSKKLFENSINTNTNTNTNTYTNSTTLYNKNNGLDGIARHIQACKSFSNLIRFVPTQIHNFEEELIELNKNNFIRFIQQELSEIHEKNQLYSQLIRQNSLYQFSQYEIYQLNQIFSEVKILQKQSISLLQMFIQINFQVQVKGQVKGQYKGQYKGQFQQQTTIMNFKSAKQKQAVNNKLWNQNLCRPWPYTYNYNYNYNYNQTGQKRSNETVQQRQSCCNNNSQYCLPKSNRNLSLNHFQSNCVFNFTIHQIKQQHRRLLLQNSYIRININQIYSTVEKQIRQQKRKIMNSKVFSMSTLKIMENNSIMFHNPSLRERWNEYLSEVYNLIYDNAYKKICNEETIVRKQSFKLIKEMEEIKNMMRYRNDEQNCKKIDEIIKMYKKM